MLGAARLQEFEDLNPMSVRFRANNHVERKEFEDLNPTDVGFRANNYVDVNCYGTRASASAAHLPMNLSLPAATCPTTSGARAKSSQPSFSHDRHAGVVF